MRQLKISKLITNRSEQSVDKYLREVASIPLISADEEVELSIRIKQNDNVALKKLIKANLRFVISVAKQFQNRGLSLSDLINEGNIGLIFAAKNFDHSKGFKFISFAVWKIRESIQKAIYENGKMVRIPYNKAILMNNINKKIALFEQEHNYFPTMDDFLNKYEKYSENDLKNIFNCTDKHVSIDATVSNCENENFTISETLESDYYKSDELVMCESLIEDIEKIFDNIPDRESNVLRCLYGINTRILSINEIADQYGLCIERVRQIKANGLRRMKYSKDAVKLKEYLINN